MARHNACVESTRFAVIDTETTGLDPALDAVVSVALVPVEDGVIHREEVRHVFVNPGFPIPAASFEVHGIGDEDVRGAPDVATAVAGLADGLAGRVIVGHNLAFDLAFLQVGGLQAAATVDTLEVSRVLWPGLGVRHTLDDVAARVDVSPRDRHSALGDAVATAEVLVACLPLLAARGIDSPEALSLAYRAQRVRRARLRRSIRRRNIRRRRRRARRSGHR